jgi:hypothetical protein
MTKKIDDAYTNAANKLTEIGTKDALTARAVLTVHYDCYRTMNEMKAMRAEAWIDAMVEPATEFVKWMAKDSCAPARDAAAYYLDLIGRWLQKSGTFHWARSEEIAKLPPPPPPPEPTEPEQWFVAPAYYYPLYKGERSTSSSSPIQDVIGANTWSSSSKNRPRKCATPATINLTAGDHPHFRITHTASPDDRPIRIVGQGPGTRIMPNSVGGSQTLYAENCQYHELANLTIVGDDMAALMTENPSSKRFDSWDERPVTRDLKLFDVNIDGGWDHSISIEDNLALGRTRCKWGLQSYELGTSRSHKWGFDWMRGVLRGIFKEQFGYFHTPKGTVRLSGLNAYGCGRSFAQIACRDSEGGAGEGKFLIENCTIADTCLQPGGGGSAISLNGNYKGILHVRDTVIKLGCTKSLHSDYSDNITGCFVAYSGKNDEGDLGPRNKEVVLEGNTFEVGEHYPGKGSARRTNVSVGMTDVFRMRGTKIVQHQDAFSIALEVKETTGHVEFGYGNEVIGDVIYKGQKFIDPQRNGAGYQEMRKNVF